MADDKIFYFISYSLPVGPSRIRVYVWRWLKRIGALNMQQSLWLLPHDNHMLKALNKIKDSIEKDGGKVYIVSGQFIHGTESIVQRFRDERDSEYKELLEYCEKFHEEMRVETERRNFSFAELEENEEEYKKLSKWFEKIRKRDYFDAPLGSTASDEMSKCREEFEEFTAWVYQDSNID